MAADFGGSVEIPNWAITLASSALTAVGGFILAFVNRGPAMQAAWLAANKDLITGYGGRVSELTAEVHSLRAEIVSLRKALDETTRELHEVKSSQGFGV